MGRGYNAIRGRMAVNSFRFSEESFEAFRQYVVKSEPGSMAMKSAKRVLKANLGEKLPSDPVELERLAADYVYCREVLKFKEWEYFTYELGGKTPEEKHEFVRQLSLLSLYKRVYDPKQSEAVRTLQNKGLCYKKFEPFFKRDALVLRSNTKMRELTKFTGSHSQFFVKPLSGSLGEGVRLIDTKDYRNVKELRSDISGKSGVILEERIIPHPKIAELYPDAVNCVRIVTYWNGSDFDVMFPWIKVGSGGAVIDNAGAGGLAACIDLESGEIISDAGTEGGLRYKQHPDTGTTFKGFQIPEWSDLVQTAIEAARLVPDGQRPVGWDFALSADKGWQMIEGNSRSQIGVYQVPQRKGIRKELIERLGLPENTDL